MGFWLIAIALALAVGGLLVLALLRVRTDGAAAPAFDVQVYRDQLAEVDRDLRRGVLSEDEAARVRVEVSRRLLEADRAAGEAAGPATAPAALSGVTAALVALVVVGGAAGLYATIGAPGYPDLPLDQRIADAELRRADRPAQAEFEAQLGRSFAPPEDADPQFLDLMDKLRTAVADNPDELQGQMLLARNEAMLGNYAGAHPAQARVIALRGDAATADEYATLADLLVLAAEGYVSPEAEAALQKALELEPRNGPARYYAGLMYAQNARPDMAYRFWRPLLAESRPEAPWVAPITSQIEQVAQAAGIRFVPPEQPAAAALSGPSAADVEAAQDMSDEDRTAMIRNMVNGLAERLANEGGVPAEWARLINALGVLGETGRAGAIWTEAQQVFAESPEALATIRGAAESAGVAE